MSSQQALSPPKIILLLGKTGVGKSTFVNIVTGLDVPIGDSLYSCTAEPQLYPIPSTNNYLLDTPGFDDPARSDTQILSSIAACLADLHEGLLFPAYTVNLSGIIYIQPINEERITGSTLKNLGLLRPLVGETEREMEHVVLVTSKWALIDRAVAQQRESDLMSNEGYWGGLLAAGAGIARYYNTPASALEIIAQASRGGPFTPRITREYILEGKPLADTMAGKAIDTDVREARKRHERELQQAREEITRNINKLEAQAASELSALAAKTEERIRAADREIEELKSTREEAQVQMDEVESKTLAERSSSNKVLESKSAPPILSPSTIVLTPLSSTANLSSVQQVAENERRHVARQRRALRWLGRAAALTAGVTMTAMTGGVLAPVGLAVYTVVEAWCQSSKDREVEEAFLIIEKSKRGQQS